MCWSISLYIFMLCILYTFLACSCEVCIPCEPLNYIYLTDILCSVSRFPGQHVRGKLPQLTGRPRRTPWRRQATGNAPTESDSIWRHRVQAPPPGHQAVHEPSCANWTTTPAGQHQALRDATPQHKHTRPPSGEWKRTQPDHQTPRRCEHWRWWPCHAQ